MFLTEIHANNILLFLISAHQHIKTIQNIQNILNFSQKKLIFLGTRFAPRSQTVLSICDKYPIFLKNKLFSDVWQCNEK
jgi:hypothetical protein